MCGCCCVVYCGVVEWGVVFDLGGFFFVGVVYVGGEV